MNDIKLVLETFVNQPLVMFVGLLASVSTLSCLLIIAYYIIKGDMTTLKKLISDDSSFYKYFKVVFMISFTIILMTFVEGMI